MSTTTPYYYRADNGKPIIVQGEVVDAAPVATSTDGEGGEEGSHHSYYYYKQTAGAAAAGHPPSIIQESSPYNSYPSENNNDGIIKVGGEQQPKRCRDPIWAIFFYIHIITILIATIKFVPSTFQTLILVVMNDRRRYLEDNNDNAEDDDNNNMDIINARSFILMFLVAGLGSLCLSTLALALIMSCAQTLIKMALFFNIFVCIGLLVIALISPSGTHIEIAMIAFVVLLFSIYYTYIVWNRIEFAASNLTTAISSIKANIGLSFFAYINLILSFLWSVWWAITCLSTFFVLGECDTDGNCQNDINGFLIFLFLVSYFWTVQVLKNIVHVTVAGCVGTWWMVPNEANGCCSKAVRQSYLRSITSSFGSICLGSLLVALIQAIKEIVHAIRESGDASIITCLADFILGCLKNLVEYFNQWAFVYVGIYGYAFLQAGSNAMNLFKERGWTAIIADILVDTVLFMVTICVSLLTGIVGLIVAAGTMGMMNVDSTYLAGSFVIGILIGYIMCSTLFSLVSSAVNSVIVCYAEAPFEFDQNHPHLSVQMRSAWRKAYPSEFKY